MLTNRVLSIMMALFGITACDDNFTCAYGSPYGTFEVTGTVTDEEGNAVSEENIIIKFGNYRPDTVKTSDNGFFKYTNDHTWPNTSDTLSIIANDSKGVYKNDTTKTFLEQTEKGEDWYVGKYIKNVNIKLKKNTK